MDSFEINKIVASILLIALLFIGIGKISDLIFHVEKPKTPGYKVELPEEGKTTQISEIKSECNEIINPKDENDSSLHRFLCVTSDRLLVLDSGGKGEGNIAKVDANHHLTRLEKLTFRKREPDVINIFMKDSDIAYSFRGFPIP